MGAGETGREVGPPGCAWVASAARRPPCGLRRPKRPLGGASGGGPGAGRSPSTCVRYTDRYRNMWLEVLSAQHGAALASSPTSDAPSEAIAREQAVPASHASSHTPVVKLQLASMSMHAHIIPQSQCLGSPCEQGRALCWRGGIKSPSCPGKVPSLLEQRPCLLLHGSPGLSLCCGWLGLRGAGFWCLLSRFWLLPDPAYAHPASCASAMSR